MSPSARGECRVHGRSIDGASGGGLGRRDGFVIRPGHIECFAVHDDQVAKDLVGLSHPLPCFMGMTFPACHSSRMVVERPVTMIGS
jgi:hypothetical protein